MSTPALTSNAYRVATEACALLDRSERGKLALSGAGAAEFLQGQVSNDVEALSDGTGCYAALLTPKGKMLADLRVLRTADELLLDTERPSLQVLFNTLRRAMIGYDVALHKRTLERGLLSLVGPQAAALAGTPELEAADEPAHLVVEIGGVEGRVQARAIRTDLGVDLLCDSARTEALRRALLEAGAAEVDEGTVECLRIERGRPRYGLDLDETVIPQEAGLNDRVVSFAKGCYVGQETVARLFYRGKPNRHLRGLRLTAAEKTGAELRHDGREVGRLGSVADSPRLGPIALALVRREVPVGARLSVGDGGVQAELVELPFALAA